MAAPGCRFKAPPIRFGGIRLLPTPALVLTSWMGSSRFLASTLVHTDAAGIAPYVLRLSSPVPIGQFLTATATDEAGNTSEFSNAQDGSGTPIGIFLQGDLTILGTD